MKIKIIFVLVLVIAAACSSKKDPDSQTAHEHQTYYCPMHPEVTSDKPGICPICNMDLVLKGSDDASADIAGIIKLSEGKQIMANVKTIAVFKERVIKEIKSFGNLDFAEPGRRSITARFNGRIEKLYINKVGDVVKPGTPLFDVYSPELVQAQNEYLISLNSNNSGSLTDAITEKLLIYGITKVQIDELRSSKKVKNIITYYSPFGGTVIEKKVLEGTYINEGMSLYEIADMSVIWNISEVFSDDIGLVKKGMPVKLTTASYGGQVFNGIVDFIYPVAEQQNKTVKVRSVIQNSSGMLRPNLFTEAIFRIDLGSYITIPVESVVITGTKNIVWVKKDTTLFELRELKLGVKAGTKFQVLDGLTEGEEIAATGGYLIDSENQLKSGTGSTQASQTAAKELFTPDHKKIWNTICPVMGNPVDPEAPTVEYKGKLIGFCCGGCDDKFKAEPEKYMANLNKEGNKFIGKTN